MSGLLSDYCQTNGNVPFFPPIRALSAVLCGRLVSVWIISAHWQWKRNVPLCCVVESDLPIGVAMEEIRFASPLRIQIKKRMLSFVSKEHSICLSLNNNRLEPYINRLRSTFFLFT